MLNLRKEIFKKKIVQISLRVCGKVMLKARSQSGDLTERTIKQSIVMKILMIEPKCRHSTLQSEFTMTIQTHDIR